MTASTTLPLFSTSSSERRQRRVAVLSDLGAREEDLHALLAYTQNAFNPPEQRPLQLPLANEPSAEDWRRYAAAARNDDAFSVLQEHLVQLRFPIRRGISDTTAYRKATRALSVTDVSSIDLVDGGLQLQAPERMRVELHGTPAGDVPVVVAGSREDFIALFRALLKANEPVDVPDAMGAVMVSGYPNWSRLHTYRRATAPSGIADDAWPDRFRRDVPDGALYKDRFMLLSPTPYSAVPAADLGLEEDIWREASVAIRRAHEAAHYVTRRVLGAMSNSLHDELLADYMGITAVEPRFRSDWFLRFLGLENAPAFRQSGRLSAYRGDPPLSDAAFEVVQRLAVAAAETVETADAERETDVATGRVRMLLALAAMTVEELAAPDGTDRLHSARQIVREQTVFNTAS